MAARVPSGSVPAREASLCSGNLQTQQDFQRGLRMQIAQIAPLTEAIPPKLYGGTERVISWLGDELVALGHDVVLFASGDSQTSAHLEACWPKALRLDGSVRDPNALHMTMLEQVRQRAHDFDLLHFHLDYYPFSLFSRHGGKTGKTDNNLSENATNRNREPVGELARAWSCVTHSDRGLSHPDARPSANMPPDGPRFANRRSRTRRRHVRARPVRRPTTK